jgi:hypothetical protein
MIVIRHRTGPLAGKEQRIETKSDRITFGRDPDVCDVVYPADATIVARRHFALVKKPSGEWTFDLFGNPFVAMNGEPVDEAEAVRSGARIELGRHGGPAFEIDLAGETLASTLPVTDAQEEVEGSHAAALRARRYAIAGVLLAILAGGGAAGILYFGHSEGARLSKAVADVAEDQKRVAAQTISADVRDRLLQAAYLVGTTNAQGRSRPAGSASPIGPDLLATNAHIVQDFLDLKPGERMFVRAPGATGKIYQVIEARKHPGYDAFMDYIRNDPIYVTTSSNCPTCPLPDSLSASLSYDVGTLRVAPGSDLSPILEVASREDLAKLGPGFPLALAGYPTEAISGAEVQPLSATPNLSIGMITAITDMFNLPGEAAHRFLIRHNLPITGGSSGSPMVGPSGKIVAFNNAESALHVSTSIVWTGRIPSAALINYAQRADLILDLLADSGSCQLDQERTYWAKQTESFKRGFDVVVPAILAHLKTKDGMTAELASQAKFTLGSGDQIKLRNTKGEEVPARQHKQMVKVDAGKPYVFIGYAEGAAKISLYLFVGDKLVAKDEGDDWHPFISYTPAQDGTIEIDVLGPDKDLTYTFLQYSWTGPPS